MKRLVLFVEGEGEAEAAPKLVKRLLTELNAWDAVSLDDNPFRVGHVNHLVKDGYREWKRKLAAAMKRRNVGGVLLLLDGDARNVAGAGFCAAIVARLLAKESRAAGAGATFSVAVVFARQEFETWLIAGLESLAGRQLSDGRLVARQPARSLRQVIWRNRRNAKGWLSQFVEGGYKPTRDQALLTALVDLTTIRSRNVRSFRRLESALSELTTAIRSNTHVATPS